MSPAGPPTQLRLATFNLENLDDRPGLEPGLAERAAVLRPALQRLAADVLCVQEVNAQDREDGRTLAALDHLLTGTPYAAYHRAVTTNDKGTAPRDVHNLVIVSRFPIALRRQVRHDLVPPPLVRPVTADPPAAAPLPIAWDRPILHVRILLGDGLPPLEVINLHLRAPLPAFIAGQKAGAFAWASVGGWAEGFLLAALKRNGQALEARILVEQLFDADPDAWIAVCGDFNAQNREVPTAILRADVEDTGHPRLGGRVLVALGAAIPESERFKVRHAGRTVMMDHILVSRPLLARFRTAEVHNELLADELVAFATGRRDPESFHAPVVAAFSLTTA
ncbi:MAG: endonuclease [Alphaproteobacteria bacterium]|nr:endonuclease [Alphaproteobacteria bacterium]